MDDFWIRKARARYGVWLAITYVYVSCIALALGVYLMARSGVLWAGGWAVPEIDPLELMAAGSAGATLAWMFMHTIRNHATRLLLVGLRVRGLGDREEGYVALRQILADLKPRLSIPRLEVTIAPIPAINTLSFRTFDDRNHLIVTEGAVMRLSPRHLYALVAHGMARLVLPEARAWSVFVIFFGALQQIQYRVKHGLKGREKVPFSKLKMLGGFFALMGRPTVMLVDPETAQRADHEAALHTRDPIGLAEMLYNSRHQWRGGLAWSPYLSYGSALDARPARALSSEVLGALPLTALFPPLPRRIRALISMAERTAALEFDTELARRKVQRRPISRHAAEEDDTQGYLVYHEGEVHGPHSVENLLAMPWFHAQTLTRPILSSTETKMAFQFEDLYEALATRPGYSIRSMVSMESLEFGVHSMELCPQSSGLWVHSDVIGELAIQVDPRFTAVFFEQLFRQLEREVRIWNREKWTDDGRVYPPLKSESAEQAFRFLPVHPSGCVVCLYSVADERYWLNAEDLSYLVADFPRVTELPPLAEAEEEPTDLAEIYGLRRLAPAVFSYDSGASKASATPKKAAAKKGKKRAEERSDESAETATSAPPDPKDVEDRGLTGADLFKTPDSTGDPASLGSAVQSSGAPGSQTEGDAAGEGASATGATGIRRRGGLIGAAYVPADPEEIKRRQLSQHRKRIREKRIASRPLQSEMDDPPPD